MREFSVLKDRILEFAAKTGITKYEIYQNTGISNGVFSQKGGLSEDNLLKFLSYYKDISPEWLLTGNGNMLRDETSQIKNEVTQTNFQDGNEYILRRFEELVVENSKLKGEINAIKSNKEQPSNVVLSSYIEKEIKKEVKAIVAAEKRGEYHKK